MERKELRGGFINKMKAHCSMNNESVVSTTPALELIITKSKTHFPRQTSSYHFFLLKTLSFISTLKIFNLYIVLHFAFTLSLREMGRSLSVNRVTP